MSRRELIKMSPEEVASFLAEERVLTCATIGPRGWPHLMPLWYVMRGAPEQADGLGTESGPPQSRSRVWAWTYAASQKVRNLERDARATLQVETGEQYQELRGVMIECDVVIHRDTKIVAALGHEIFSRYASPRDVAPVKELSPEVGAMVDRQAAKRVALEFCERFLATWDHRKLGEVY